MQSDDTDFVTYSPVVLGFILDVEDVFLLKKIKLTVVESVRRVENDDRVYLWHYDHKEIPRWPGQAVATIAKYRPPVEFKLGQALEETVKLIDREDFDMERHVFVILDNEKDIFWGRMESAMRAVQDVNCAVHFVFMGDGISERTEAFLRNYQSHCDFVRLATNCEEELENLISRSYSDDVPPVPGCGKLNIEQLRRDYEYNYSPRKVAKSRKDDEIHD